MSKLLRQNFVCNNSNFYFFCKNKVIVFLLFIVFVCQETKSQNLVFATTITSEDHVTNSNLASDSDLTTWASVRANSGLLLGAGAYNGYIELEFPSVLPANTTTYLKIQTEDNLLDVLLGGELGNVLSDVLGVVLIGNQEFTVQAKNNSTVVLEGNSEINYAFSGPRLKVISDEFNNRYLMITPSQAYNRIRITDRVGSLIGLNNTKDLWVYGAFYYDPPLNCGSATYTSYSGTGLSLDLLTLGGAGVQNPHHVIDSDLNSYSRLSLGVIAVAGSIEQTVYFQGLSNSTDSFIVRLKVDPSLLALGLANNVRIVAFNGPNVVQDVDLNSLLNLDLLTLLAGNQIVSIPFTPNIPVDRVTVRYNSLINVQLTQSLDLYDIIRVPQMPTIDVASQNATICSGNSASLIAYSDPTSLEIVWYDEAVGGNFIGTTQSGEAFITSIINTPTTFYVATRRANCPEESLRVPIVVNVNQSPTASDINVAGNELDICAINPTVLTPSSTLSSVFEWYMSNDYTQPITNGMTLNGVTYTVDANGVLTVIGLTDLNSPYIFYVSTTNESTSCKNIAGDLKEVEVVIIDILTPTTLDDTQGFCISEAATIAQLQTNESNVIWYDSPNGGTALSGNTPLVDNGAYYASQIGSNSCESSTRLMVTVTLNDSAVPTTLNDTQEFCVAQSATIAQLQINESNIIWYDNPNGGTALSNTTLLVNNGVYYASQIGLNGCESSSKLMITVILNDYLAPTTNDITQEFCIVDLATVSQLQTNEAIVTWYDIPVGGTALPGNTPLVDNGVYYASQIGPNGCESSTRLMVTVDLDDTAPPTTTNTNQEFCVVQDATVAQLQTNEFNIVWYDVPNGGTALPNTTSLVDNGVYYAAHLGTNGCESSTRLMITVSLSDTATPTTTNTTQEFCVISSATVAQLQTNETNIVWYNVPVGGNALPNTTLLVDNEIYYASQIGANSCESSNRLMITVNLNDSNAPTTTNTSQEFCITSAATISQLHTNESNAIWYDVPFGGSALSTTTPLVNNGIYYASYVGSNGCESSNRLVVTVNLNDSAPPTTTNTTQEFCISQAATVAELQANGSNVIWYDVPFGGTALPSTTSLIDNAVYYATQTEVNGCESSERLMITVAIILNSSTIISPSNLQVCLGNSNTYTTTSGMSNYQWEITGGTITNGGGINDNTVTVQWSATTGTQVSVTYNDTNGCGGLASASFTEMLSNCSDLVIDKSVSNSTPTPGETIQFTISVTNDGNTVFSNVEVNDVLPSGYNFVSASASSGNYDQNTGVWLIPSIDQNGQATLIMTVTVNSMGEYLNIATITNSSPIDVDLSNNSDDAIITIECFTVYNEFSPNDDGVNDHFEIDCIGNYSSSKVEIFNRFGNVVYKKASYNNDWNGVANVSGVVNKGETLPVGTYFYILTIDEINYKKTGWVYIAK